MKLRNETDNIKFVPSLNGKITSTVRPSQQTKAPSSGKTFNTFMICVDDGMFPGGYFRKKKIDNHEKRIMTEGFRY